MAAHAETALALMDASYAQHEDSGDLRGALSMTMGTGYERFGVEATLTNKAPHAYWIENGTQMRHTSKGASRGQARPFNVFIPIMQRQRRLMVHALIRVVERAGFLVSATDTDLAA